MLVLITYDVNTEDASGRKRLRQIARQCVNYGQRVQCSVFECLMDSAQCKLLQAKKGTACDSTILEIAMKTGLSILDANRPICQRNL